MYPKWRQCSGLGPPVSSARSSCLSLKHHSMRPLRLMPLMWVAGRSHVAPVSVDSSSTRIIGGLSVTKAKIQVQTAAYAGKRPQTSHSWHMITRCQVRADGGMIFRPHCHHPTLLDYVFQITALRYRKPSRNVRTITVAVLQDHSYSAEEEPSTATGLPSFIAPGRQLSRWFD